MYFCPRPSLWQADCRLCAICNKHTMIIVLDAFALAGSFLPLVSSTHVKKRRCSSDHKTLTSVRPTTTLSQQSVRSQLGSICPFNFANQDNADWLAVWFGWRWKTCGLFERYVIQSYQVVLWFNKFDMVVVICIKYVAVYMSYTSFVAFVMCILYAT